MSLWLAISGLRLEVVAQHMESSTARCGGLPVIGRAGLEEYHQTMVMEAGAIPNKSNLTRFKLVHELFVPKD